MTLKLVDEERRRQQQLEEMRTREAEQRARQEEHERGRREAEEKVLAVPPPPSPGSPPSPFSGLSPLPLPLLALPPPPLLRVLSLKLVDCPAVCGRVAAALGSLPGLSRAGRSLDEVWEKPAFRYFPSVKAGALRPRLPRRQEEGYYSRLEAERRRQHDEVERQLLEPEELGLGRPPLPRGYEPPAPGPPPPPQRTASYLQAQVLSPDALYTAKLVAYTEEEEEEEEEDGGPAVLRPPPPNKPSFCRLSGRPLRSAGHAPPAVERGSLWIAGLGLVICSTHSLRPALLLWGRPSQGACSNLCAGNRPVSSASRRRQPSSVSLTA
ncbi:hypothetical protein J1605_020616 [Eschrichtius robustus]|uniref:Uncharacterized protein n=1 Tax=Eschrichtius robustus TaxID=9764 RepID=A0AB34HL32_ESCRO|nr:hypothetical protein J1605_020616 [Eschrichtius robustus]